MEKEIRGCMRAVMRQWIYSGVSFGHNGQKREGERMKKREFQKKTTAELFQKLAEVFAELGENPNVAFASRYNNTYIKLRYDYNLVQISIKQTGELSYQLTDMLGSTGGRKIYYQYRENDDFEKVIAKFAADFGRLCMDFLRAGTLHDFVDIELCYEDDVGEKLKDYEHYMNLDCQ